MSQETLLAMPGQFEIDCQRDGKFAYSIGQKLIDVGGNTEKVWQDPYVSWRNWPVKDNNSVSFFPEKVRNERCLYSAKSDVMSQHCHVRKV